MPVVPNPGIRIDGKLNNPRAATRKNLSTDMKVGRQNIFDYTDSAVSDGSTDARAAILASDAVGPVLLPPGTYAIASNTAITNRITFDPGAKLKPASGVTITLSGGYIAENTQHVFDISAGGSFIIRNMSELWGAHFGAIGDYSYPATGTDNSTVLQALFDTTNEMAQAVGSVARKQAWAKLHPGSYRCNSGLTVGNYVNLDMSGVLLMYFGSRASSGAFLTIGETGGAIETGTFYMPAIQGSPFDFDMPANEVNFAGIHLKNCGSSIFYGDYTYAFGIGLLLKSDGDSYVAHNHFINFKFSIVKTAIEFFGTSPIGWVNENVFTNCNWTATSTENGWGTLIGIHFTGEVGGYNGQNNNRFYGFCFQPAGLATDYELDIGDTVVAHQRYINIDNLQEYICVTGGVVATVPTELDGDTSSPDANGVVFTHVGHYFRVPVHFNNAGGTNLFHGCRWEYGYGPFAMITQFEDGQNWSNVRGNEMHAYEYGEINSRNKPAIDEYTTSTINLGFGTQNTFRTYGQTPDDKIRFDGIHKRFIASSSGMCVRGMAFYDYFTDLVKPYSDYVEFKLFKDHLWQQAYMLLGAVIDISICRRVQISTENQNGVTGTTNWAVPLDINQEFVEVPDDETMWCFGTGYKSTGRWYIGAEPLFFGKGTKDEIVYAFLGTANNTDVTNIDISVVPGGTGRSTALSVVTPDIGRFSHGTPTAGFFETLGEYISNIDTTIGQPTGWIVKTAGILAPAWAATTAVTIGELRKSDTDKIYEAKSTGTTGATAPTGTGTSIDDDNILWDYVGPIATLKADYPPEDSLVDITLNSAGTGTDWSAANTYLSSMDLVGDFDITFNWVDRQQNALAGVCTDTAPLAGSNYTTPEFGVYWISDTTVQVWKTGVSANHTIATWGNGFVRIVRSGTVLQLYIDDTIVSGATDISFSTATMRRIYTSLAATASEVTIYGDYETPLYQGSSLDAAVTASPSSDSTQILSFSATPVFRWVAFPQLNKSITLTADVTGAILLANTPGNYYLIVVQDGSGGHTFTIATTVIGNPPTIGLSIGDSTIIPLRFTGSTWFYLNPEEDNFVESLGSLGSGTEVFNFNNGSGFHKKVIATGSIALQFVATRVGYYTALVEIDTAGSPTISYVTTVEGTAPTIDNSDNALNIIPLFYDGTTWYHV